MRGGVGRRVVHEGMHRGRGDGCGRVLGADGCTRGVLDVVVRKGVV